MKTFLLALFALSAVVFSSCDKQVAYHAGKPQADLPSPTPSVDPRKPMPSPVPNVTPQ